MRVNEYVNESERLRHHHEKWKKVKPNSLKTHTRMPRAKEKGPKIPTPKT